MTSQIFSYIEIVQSEIIRLLPDEIVNLGSKFSSLSTISLSINFFGIFLSLFIFWILKKIFSLIFSKSIESKGKVIVVTGAGRGLGHAITLQCVKMGCKVYALDLNLDALKETYSGNTSVVPLACDVTSMTRLEEIQQIIHSNGDIVYGLVNNAGIPNPFLPLVMQTKKHMDMVINVNLMGPLYGIRVFGEDLVKTSGSVINMSSFSHFAHPAFFTTYATTKTALEAASNCIRREFNGECHPFDDFKFKGLAPPRVTCIEPFFVNTSIYQVCNDQTSQINLDPSNSMTRRIQKSLTGDASKKLTMIPASLVAENVTYALFSTNPPQQIPILPASLFYYRLLMYLPNWVVDILATPTIRRPKKKSQ